ncbi:MAG: flagellar motor switch protein FliM [Gammaproteobacteria bacterium]|nr:flagellar motor switch protein FliM [Gammaproteobacteria bacterium]MDE2250874.1 flagellar motor switch protein FliM [Gammaproteobacteria bacterium]
MTDPEVLKQEEIDALLGGVNRGEISTADERGPAGTPRRYDFRSEIPVAGGRMPKLAMVNERFARLFRASLSAMLRHAALVSVMPVAAQRCADYLRTLALPSSINLVRLAPLRGAALMVLAPTLVSAVVDKYFGGSGRAAKIEGREFTATEARIAELMRKSVFADLREAWAPAVAIEPEYFATETNAQFVNQISPAELLVIAPFRIDLDGDGGELQLVLPQSMLEPLRDRLDFGLRGNTEKPDARWYESLRGEVEQAEVGIRTVLGHAEVTLGRLLALRPGDVVPFDFAGQATVYAEGVPIFAGGFGGSRGQEAVKVERGVRR